MARNIEKMNFISMLQDFVTGLSILSRGSIDEKLRWTFSLYDINGDGCITREEMTDIVTAVYELMGKFADPNLDHEGVREKVDRMFQVRFFFFFFPLFSTRFVDIQYQRYLILTLTLIRGLSLVRKFGSIVSLAEFKKNIRLFKKNI